MNDTDLATGYVLGTLDAAGRETARRRMDADRSFAGLVESWEMRLQPLANGASAPPAGLLDRIECRIANDGLDLPGTLTSRADGARWEWKLPGVEMRTLYRNEALRRQTVLVHMEAGALYPEHGHDEQDEEIYIVEGDLRIGALLLKAGDFHLARANRVHPEHTSPSGCVAIINQGY